MLSGNQLRDNVAHVEKPQGQTTEPGALGANIIARREEKQILRPPRRTLQKLDALLVSIEQLGPGLSDRSSPRN